MLARTLRKAKKLQKLRHQNEPHLKARELKVSGTKDAPKKPEKRVHDLFSPQRADQHALPAYLIYLGFLFLMVKEILVSPGSPESILLSALVLVALPAILLLFAFLQNQITDLNAKEIQFYDAIRSKKQ